MGPLSEILTAVNIRYAASRIWTCTEPGFRLCWKTMCGSDNHYATAPQRKYRFLKIFMSIYLEKFDIYFHLSQSVSPALVLNDLVMIKIEGFIACKYFKRGNIGDICSNLAYFVHFWNILISLIIKNNKSSTFSLFSKLKFDWVRGKMLNGTYLKIK